jgi:hypothetical protein
VYWIIVLLPPRKKIAPGAETRTPIEDRSLPVWFSATERFYKKLNRLADEYCLSRIEVLEQALDAFVERQHRERELPIQKKVGKKNAEVLRTAMSTMVRGYWATLTPEERSERAKKAAKTRYNKPKSNEAPSE